MHYRTTYGGGLGDIINQIFRNGTYNSLNDLKPEDTCEVILITHNPFAKELFEFHPKAKQLDIKIPGYWAPDSNIQMYQKHGLSLIPDNLPVHNERMPVFYERPEERNLLLVKRETERKSIVISAGAGEVERNIPDHILLDIADYLWGKNVELNIVGKNYERPQVGGGKRGEPFPYPERSYIHNLIDRLSIPATLNLVKQSNAVISCHSSVCLMAWNIRRPNLIFLPKSLGNKHGIAQGQINEWTFGRAYPETHLTFNEDYQHYMLDDLLRKLNAIEMPN